MAQESILFVDDEQPILRALFRLFRESGYEIHVANNGEEALGILAGQKIDVVVSDMMMPSMSGYELLLKVKEAHPDTTRIVLSGYSKEQEVFRSLLDGTAKMYLMKPWHNEELVEVVDNVFKLRRLLRDKNMTERISHFEHLPVVPKIYAKVCELINAEADIGEIATVIEQEPVVALRILKMANSAFCSVKTGSLQKAVSYLGLNVVKNIVLASNVFAPAGDGKKRAMLEIFWRHSVLSNRIMQEAAKKIKGKTLGKEQMSVALTHDIGRLAMLNEFGDRYMEFMHESEGAYPECNMAERELFGITHCEIGGYLLDWWNMPYSFVEAAMFYHEPIEAPVSNREMVSLVHLADYYSWARIKPDSGRVLKEEVFSLLGLDKEEIEKMVNELPEV